MGVLAFASFILDLPLWSIPDCLNSELNLKACDWSRLIFNIFNKWFWLVVQVLTDSDGHVHVESTKGHCIFTIEGAERQDEGVYSVIVRNPAGEDTADINVKVVGKLF